MHCIIYMSAASTSLTAGDIEDIWEKSKANNDSNDITGLLLYGRNVFMQCLEGPESNLRALYTKIESDKRHGAIVSLYNGPVNDRHFADWSMGYKSLSASETESIANDLNWQWASEKLESVQVMSEPASLLKRMKTIYFDRSAA